jgi:hypothetical protein
VKPLVIDTSLVHSTCLTYTIFITGFVEGRFLNSLRSYTETFLWSSWCLIGARDHRQWEDNMAKFELNSIKKLRTDSQVGDLWVLASFMWKEKGVSSTYLSPDRKERLRNHTAQYYLFEKRNQEKDTKKNVKSIMTGQRNRVDSTSVKPDSCWLKIESNDCDICRWNSEVEVEKREQSHLHSMRSISTCFNRMPIPRPSSPSHSKPVESKHGTLVLLSFTTQQNSWFSQSNS